MLHATTCYNMVRHQNALVIGPPILFAQSLAHGLAVLGLHVPEGKTAKKVIPATLANMQHQYQYVSNSIISQSIEPNSINLTTSCNLVWISSSSSGFMDRYIYGSIRLHRFDFPPSNRPSPAQLAALEAVGGSRPQSCWRIQLKVTTGGHPGQISGRLQLLHVWKKEQLRFCFVETF